MAFLHRYRRSLSGAGTRLPIADDNGVAGIRPSGDRGLRVCLDVAIRAGPLGRASHGACNRLVIRVEELPRFRCGRNFDGLSYACAVSGFLRAMVWVA